MVGNIKRRRNRKIGGEGVVEVEEERENVREDLSKTKEEV